MSKFQHSRLLVAIRAAPQHIYYTITWTLPFGLRKPACLKMATPKPSRSTQHRSQTHQQNSQEKTSQDQPSLRRNDRGSDDHSTTTDSMTDNNNARHDVNEAVTETQKDTMYHHATRHQKHQSLHHHDRLYQRVATSTNHRAAMASSPSSS